MQQRGRNLLFLLCLPWSLAAQTPVWDQPCHPDDRETYSAVFSSDSGKVLSSSECDNAHVRLWSAADGAMLWDSDVGTALMCLVGAQFSASGSHFAVMEELGNVLIYDYSGPTPVLAHTVDMGISASYSLDFSPDDTKLVADGTGGTLRIYDVASGTLLQSIPGNLGTVFTVDWSPDGSLIAAGSQDNNVRLWNAADGALAATLSGHSTDIRSVRFNATGDHIVTASSNGEVKLWMHMMGGWMEHAAFTVPEAIHQVDISDDDRYIIVGGTTTTHVYEAMTGDPIATFNLPDGGDVWTVDFKPGSCDAVTGTSSGRVVYWALESLLRVPEHAALDVQVYPVPTSDMVNITVGSFSGPCTAEVFTLDGRPVRTERFTAPHETLNLNGLSAGDYLLRSRCGEGIRTLSIRKN